MAGPNVGDSSNIFLSAGQLDPWRAGGIRREDLSNAKVWEMTRRCVIGRGVGGVPILTGPLASTGSNIQIETLNMSFEIA